MAETLMRSFLGQGLRQARLQKGLTLRFVAQQAYTSFGYVSDVERGVKEVSSEKLLTLCQSLDISVPNLLEFVAKEMRDAR